LLIALVLGAAVPSAASAQAQAPPGSSAIDQYRENIPAGAGDRGPSRRQSRALEREGEDGRQLVRVLAGDGDGSGAAASGSGADAGTTPSQDDRGREASAAGPSSKADGGAASSSGRDPGGTTRADEPRDESRAKATVSASLGADVGPTKLWVALLLVLVGATGLAVLRRRAA